MVAKHGDGETSSFPDVPGPEEITPTRVWTNKEWREQQPWTHMSSGDLRSFFKSEYFIHAYSGGPNAFKNLRGQYTWQGSMTGRFKSPAPDFQFPRVSDPVYTDLDTKVAEFLKKYRGN